MDDRDGWWKLENSMLSVWLDDNDIYIYIYIYMSVCVCVCVCIYIYIYIYICVCLCALKAWQYDLKNVNIKNAIKKAKKYSKSLDIHNRKNFSY